MLSYARRPILALSIASASSLVLLSACTNNTSTTSTTEGGELSVVSSDDSCDVSAASAPSGTMLFSVTNEGSEVTEFYLLGEDGLRIVGEVENIGPGLTRDLVVEAAPGSYFTACKPGMVGEGIQAEFTVTDSGNEVGPTGETAELLERATNNYAAYVEDQASRLVVATEAFAELYINGDDDAARDSYAPTRVYWERIEPVAESFGDLDPKLDLREADLEQGQRWTGWHRIEKELWPPARGYRPMNQRQREQIASQLVSDTRVLYERVQSLEYQPSQLGNGAKELLDEVATGKVTGEEEFWSHTDLWDFQANVDGARIAYEELRPVVVQKDPELAETLDARFAEMQALLDRYRTGDGFVRYTALSNTQVKELAAAVDALGEPLSTLTSVVVL
jgi:iron uptake system component EfeO